MLIEQGSQYNNVTAGSYEITASCCFNVLTFNVMLLVCHAFKTTLLKVYLNK